VDLKGSCCVSKKYSLACSNFLSFKKVEPESFGPASDTSFVAGSAKVTRLPLRAVLDAGVLLSLVVIMAVVVVNMNFKPKQEHRCVA
jgi:hypothetical protein